MAIDAKMRRYIHTYTELTQRDEWHFLSLVQLGECGSECRSVGESEPTICGGGATGKRRGGGNKLQQGTKQCHRKKCFKKYKSVAFKRHFFLCNLHPQLHSSENIYYPHNPMVKHQFYRSATCLQM